MYHVNSHFQRPSTHFQRHFSKFSCTKMRFFSGYPHDILSGNRLFLWIGPYRHKHSLWTCRDGNLGFFRKKRLCWFSCRIWCKLVLKKIHWVFVSESFEKWRSKILEKMTLNALHFLRDIILVPHEEITILFCFINWLIFRYM